MVANFCDITLSPLRISEHTHTHAFNKINKKLNVSKKTSLCFWKKKVETGWRMLLQLYFGGP